MTRKCKNKVCHALAEGHNQYCAACRLLCATCRRKERGSNSSYCNQCSSLYQRQWAARPSGGMDERRRLKNKLRSRINRGIKEGRLERGVCAKCGTTENLQLRFRSLDEPVEYFWLCKPHHQEARNEEGRERRKARLERQAKSHGPLAENVFVLHRHGQTPETAGQAAPNGSKVAR